MLFEIHFKIEIASFCIEKYKVYKILIVKYLNNTVSQYTWCIRVNIVSQRLYLSIHGVYTVGIGIGYTNLNSLSQYTWCVLIEKEIIKNVYCLCKKTHIKNTFKNRFYRPKTCNVIRLYIKHHKFDSDDDFIDGYEAYFNKI